MDEFMMSVDLGCQGDYTAISVAQILRGQGEERAYHIRHLQRLPLGTPYPAITAAVAGMLSSSQLRGRAALLVDQTGVGLPVVHDMRKAGLAPQGIVITAGNEVATGQDGSVHVPKAHLVSAVQILLGYGRLKWSAALDHADLLEGELRDFQMKRSISGRETFNAREGAHDDLVLSVAMLCWYGENRLVDEFMWG